MPTAKIYVMEESGDKKVSVAKVIQTRNYAVELAFDPHENDFIRLWEGVVIRVRKPTYDSITGFVEVIASMPTDDFKVFEGVCKD